MSAGLFNRSSYRAVEDYMVHAPPQSGDALLFRTVWNVMNLGPTDPGSCLLPVSISVIVSHASCSATSVVCQTN